MNELDEQQRLIDSYHRLQEDYIDRVLHDNMIIGLESIERPTLLIPDVGTEDYKENLSKAWKVIKRSLIRLYDWIMKQTRNILVSMTNEEKIVKKLEDKVRALKDQPETREINDGPFNRYLAYFTQDGQINPDNLIRFTFNREILKQAIDLSQKTIQEIINTKDKSGDDKIIKNLFSDFINKIKSPIPVYKGSESLYPKKEGIVYSTNGRYIRVIRYIPAKNQLSLQTIQPKKENLRVQTIVLNKMEMTTLLKKIKDVGQVVKTSKDELDQANKQLKELMKSLDQISDRSATEQQIVTGAIRTAREMSILCTHIGYDLVKFIRTLGQYIRWSIKHYGFKVNKED